jgi:hypothetical protein
MTSLTVALVRHVWDALLALCAPADARGLSWASLSVCDMTVDVVLRAIAVGPPPLLLLPELAAEVHYTPCVHVCACMCVCVRVCVQLCMCVCV